jgi:hypothetical protein
METTTAAAAHTHNRFIQREAKTSNNQMSQTGAS